MSTTPSPAKPERNLLLHHQEGHEHEKAVLHRDIEEHDHRESAEAGSMTDAPVRAPQPRRTPAGGVVPCSEPARAQDQQEGGARRQCNQSVSERHPLPARAGAEKRDHQPAEEELAGVAARVVGAERGAPCRTDELPAHQR